MAVGAMGGLVVMFVALLLWGGAHTLMGPEPGEVEAGLRVRLAASDSTVTVRTEERDEARASVVALLAQRDEACGMLPFQTLESCLNVVDIRVDARARRAERGTR